MCAWRAPTASTAFVAGKEYSHGGLSVQECVVPQLTVRRGAKAGISAKIRDCSIILGVFSSQNGPDAGPSWSVTIGRLLIPLHVQGDTLANVFGPSALRPSVALLCLAIAPVTSFHRIVGRRQEFVIQEHQRFLVSNSPRGYQYFSEVGTSLKSVGFGEVVPVPVREAFFSRILLTTRLCRPNMI